MLRAVKIILAIFAVSTYKTLPLAWVIRFYYIVGKHLWTKRNKYLSTKENTYGLGKEQLDIFRASKYQTYASPLEIDVFMHKSNSTYFLDLDLARSEHICIMFQKLFMRYWGNENGKFKNASFGNCPYIPVGTIQCVFKREIKVFERYEIISSIMAWDNKWLYVMLKFVKKDKLCAVAVTKYVFKEKGRITMRPRDFIAESGLYNEEVEKINKVNYELISHMENSEDLEKLADEMKLWK